jgi:hypothetical protein
VKAHIGVIDGAQAGDSMCSKFQFDHFCYFFGMGSTGPSSGAPQAGMEKYAAEHNFRPKNNAGDMPGEHNSHTTQGTTTFAASSSMHMLRHHTAESDGFDTTARPDLSAHAAHIVLGSVAGVVIFGGILFLFGVT